MVWNVLTVALFPLSQNTLGSVAYRRSSWSECVCLSTHSLCTHIHVCLPSHRCHCKFEHTFSFWCMLAKSEYHTINTDTYTGTVTSSYLYMCKKGLKCILLITAASITCLIVSLHCLHPTCVCCLLCKLYNCIYSWSSYSVCSHGITVGYCYSGIIVP